MTIKFISFNIWLGGILMDGAVDFLKNENADIITLQEVYNGIDSTLAEQYRTMQILSEQLNYPYADFVPDFRDIDRVQGRAQRGNAVLSKFPIIGRDALFFDGSYSHDQYHDVAGNYHNCPRNLQHVVIQTPTANLNVYNFQGVWDIDGDNYSKQRKNMSKTILNTIQGKNNVILAGDTNAKPTNQAIKNIEDNLKSVFGHTLSSTFNMKRKDNPGYASAAVDMIFVSPDIAVVESSCPQVDISDHLPLIATIDLPISKD